MVRGQREREQSQRERGVSRKREESAGREQEESSDECVGAPAAAAPRGQRADGERGEAAAVLPGEGRGAPAAAGAQAEEQVRAAGRLLPGEPPALCT